MLPSNFQTLLNTTEEVAGCANHCLINRSTFISYPGLQTI